MARNSGDKTFKITLAQQIWAEDEQTRLKRRGLGIVTQAQLFGMMIEKYAAGTPEAKPAPLAADAVAHAAAVEMAAYMHTTAIPTETVTEDRNAKKKASGKGRLSKGDAQARRRKSG